ncbi:hypothetical protein V9T40_003526 [Parthenolecanium corni]|uniref:Major facilitator superfamily (MFS) profile domain-containing protein n=1 Tax=Parthenolecanium corni TaxID=536013 RepID=A0AAN9YA81_9HEMI
MTEMNYSSPPYKSSGKNCSNRIVRFISPVPAEECVVEVQNNYFADHSRNRSNNRSAKMKVLMRADTHKHINVIKEEDEDQKEYKCNASQVLASLTISLGSCAVGFSTAYTAPALPSMNSIDSGIHVSESEASWIGSLMPFSALIGGIIGGPLIESIGRRSTILSTAIPFTISFLLISCAPNVLTIMAGRILSGFCVGICSLALPVYLGETVQPEVRGTLGLLPTTFGNVGMLLCYVAGKYLDWRWLAVLGAGIPVPFLICMFLIPETPQWYINKDQQKKARKALQWLRGPDADVTQEFNEIEKANQANKSQDPPSFTTIFNRIYVRALLISLGLMFFQQMSGINAYMFYTVQIFKDSGSTIDSHLSSIIVGLVNFFSTFLATVFIDKLGRKVLLFISSGTMTLMLIVFGTFFYFKDQGYDLKEYGWIPLLSFVTFVLGFSAGFGPIPWLMMGEILPTRIRGSAASLATAFNWSCTFVVTKTFVNLNQLIGAAGTFWLFAAVCLVSMVFVVVWVPETQGKSLEDIERNLTGGPKGPVRHVRRMSSIAHLKPLPMAV